MFLFNLKTHARSVIVCMACLGLIITGCTPTPREVRKALRQAGSNKKELQKLIGHYKETGEQEKLKAAYFLIANMPGKSSLSSERVKDYFNILKEADSLKNAHGLTRDSLSVIVKEKLRSLEKEKGPFDYSDVKDQPDIEVITSGFLIKNIDMAFSVWKKPWAKHVSFDDFCEFILPYRIYSEPLSNWREYFYNELIHFEDSLKNPSDPKELIEKISTYLYKRWNHLDHFNEYDIFPDLIDMAKCNGGLCDHRYFLITGMMRSVGLPVAIEFTPQWTNYTGAHSWNVFIDTDGRIRPFNGGEDNFRYYDKNLIPLNDGGSTGTKVYRKTYACQKNSLPFVCNDIRSAPVMFRSKYITDVTWNYDFIKTKYTLTLDDNSHNGKIIYLAAFNYGFEKNIVAWAKVKNKQACFEYIGLPSLYVPVEIKDGRIAAVHVPLIMTWQEEFRRDYAPDPSRTITVRLVRKFNFSENFINYAKGMIGGKFQGSNTVNFSDAADLYTIDYQANAFEEVKIQNTGTYRYLRYLSPDTSAARVAEIEFFGIIGNETEQKLEGAIIGNTGYTDNKNDAVFSNAFDNNIRSNFNACPGSWVGIDLGKNRQARVTDIWFLPRNSFNVIEKGHTYELFYYLNDEWISLGRQVAYDNYLIYNEVPAETILVLKNLTQGRQERVFMYDEKNNKQIWW